MIPLILHVVDILNAIFDTKSECNYNISDGLSQLFYGYPNYFAKTIK